MQVRGRCSTRWTVPPGGVWRMDDRFSGLSCPRGSADDDEEMSTMAGTLAEKVWDAYLVRRGTDGSPDLLYIDLHLVHEVTSPQAFEGLRLAGRPVRRPDLTLATEDHNVPTEFGGGSMPRGPFIGSNL